MESDILWLNLREQESLIPKQVKVSQTLSPALNKSQIRSPCGGWGVGGRQRYQLTDPRVPFLNPPTFFLPLFSSSSSLFHFQSCCCCCRAWNERAMTTPHALSLTLSSSLPLSLSSSLLPSLPTPSLSLSCFSSSGLCLYLLLCYSCS